MGHRCNYYDCGTTFYSEKEKKHVPCVHSVEHDDDGYCYDDCPHAPQDYPRGDRQCVPVIETNTVYNESCLETMARMPDNFVDITFTSPPYNRKRNDKYEFYNDTLVDYYEFLCETTREMLRVTKGNVFINIQKNYYNKKDVFKFIGEFCDHITEMFIWEKSNPLPASGASITNAWEFVIVLGPTLKSKTTYTKNHLTTSVNTRTNKKHKAMMNKEVSDFFMSKFAHRGDIVYDPFMGSGTTAVSALENGCRYIGSDTVEEYCQMAEERIPRAFTDVDELYFLSGGQSIAMIKGEIENMESLKGHRVMINYWMFDVEDVECKPRNTFIPNEKSGKLYTNLLLNPVEGVEYV